MKSPGVLALVCLVGCGDNSKQCGPGTEEVGGVCVPADEVGLICGDGTVRDPLTNECVPDPSLCGGGTVLINGECRDPADGLPIDVEEGAEPNGFEPDATPAGVLTLKPIGEPLVIKGCIVPTGNNAPDLDVYELDVDGPTLLHVAADGVQGLAAGYLVLGDQARLDGWLRLGLSMASDTSKRELFLPVAGHYQLVMTDSRTLLPLTNNGEGFPAAGNPDGTSCYYVTINRRAIPTPKLLDLTQPNTGEIGEDLEFFTADFATGLSTMTAVIDPEDLDGDGNPDLDALGNPIDSKAASSIVLVNNNQLRQINDADASSPISSAIFGGIGPGDAPLVVLDYVWNYAVGPAAYEVEVLDQTSSQALTGTVNATSKGQVFAQDGQALFDNVNLFHFDVAASDEIDALDLAFSIPVQGSIVDQDGFIVSPLTGLASESGGTPFVDTFTSYRGLFRPFAPGRHYVFVFAPRDPVGTSFTVTSTIAPVTPTTVVSGVPAAPTAFNAVQSNVFRFAGGAEPWHTLNATADAGVGTLDVQFYDPAVTTPRAPGFAFGRLDPLVTTRDGDAPVAQPGDATPLFQPAFAVDGSTPLHAILKNPFAALPPATSAFLVKVNPTIASPTGQFTLDFSPRSYDDLGGPIASGDVTRNATMTAGSEERFFVETAPGNLVTFAVSPSGSQPNLDVVIEVLARDEQVLETIDASGAGSGEVRSTVQNLAGATAYRVRGATGASAGAYLVTVSVEPAGYVAAQAPSGFADACAGGSAVVFAPAGGDLDDEGLSQPIAAPAGFALQGDPVTSFRISTNGFLSFDAGIDEALFTPSPLADEPRVSIAPFWDDLGGVTACTKTLTGGQRVVQWEGFSFSTFGVVQFQAILDGNGTITFAYGPGHELAGDAATIGVQSGGKTLQLGFLTPVAVAASSITLTPN